MVEGEREGRREGEREGREGKRRGKEGGRVGEGEGERMEVMQLLLYVHNYVQRRRPLLTDFSACMCNS